MLFHITELSLLFDTFIALAFHNPARCLERDVETGSCARVGDKGSLFKTCVTAAFCFNNPLFSVFAPCLGVSCCSWISQLVVLR